MIGYAICFYLLLKAFVHCSDSEICSDDYCDSNYDEPTPTPNDTNRQFERVAEPRFEGDMLGFNNIEDIIKTRSDDEGIQDSALTDETKKWVDGIVYYKISKSFSCSELCIIYEAMHEMEQKTCLNFVEADHREDFIQIFLTDDVCSSFVGRQGNKQGLYLLPDCATSVGHVIHELMHAVGFFHEQSRKDRDDYIRVNFENVPVIHYPQFQAHGLGDKVITHVLRYDYNSVMHYEPYAFAWNKSVMTITAINGQEIGQREGLSDLDSERINIHYNCTNQTIGCHDTMANCSHMKNLERSCRVQGFFTKCRKTCTSCSNHKLPNRISNEDSSCRTPADRCSAWTSNSDCTIVTDFRYVQRSNCYQKCQKCP